MECNHLQRQTVVSISGQTLCLGFLSSIPSSGERLSVILSLPTNHPTKTPPLLRILRPDALPMFHFFFALSFSVNPSCEETCPSLTFEIECADTAYNGDRKSVTQCRLNSYDYTRKSRSLGRSFPIQSMP
jgi:hypothetical protein